MSKDIISSEKNNSMKNQNEALNNNTNVVLLKYLINPKYPQIKLFDSYFVKNNKNNCKIIYENNYYELTDYFDIPKNIKNNILEIKLNGINNITNASYMFYNISSLLSFDDISKCNTSNINDTGYMFYGCSSLTNLSNISGWDTSNVKTMNDMFENCSSLTSFPDISKWNTSNVTNMNCLFYGCKSLNMLPDISNWNISRVKHMNYMFCNCTSLFVLPDFSKWEISKINRSFNFNNCFSLAYIPDIYKWYKIDSSDSDFKGCINLIN